MLLNLSLVHPLHRTSTNRRNFIIELPSSRAGASALWTSAPAKEGEIPQLSCTAQLKNTFFVDCDSWGHLLSLAKGYL